MNAKWITSGLLLLAALAAFIAWPRNSHRIEPALPPVVSAESLTETEIIPHTEHPLTAGRNTVYCGTFQLAWNELQNEIIGEPILLENSPPMAEILNKQSFQRSDLSAESYLALAGSVKEGIVDTIQQQMQRRFPAAEINLPPNIRDQAIVAFTYLEKSLAFKEAFDPLTEPLVFHSEHGEHRVRAFGFEPFSVQDQSERDFMLRRQVDVLDYTSDNDFILRLNTTAANDEVILAIIKPEATLQATIAAVTRRIRQPLGEYLLERIQNAEALKIPVISLHVRRTYHELEDLDILNPNWEPFYIDQAVQGIRFRLDETGARLASEAYIAVKSEISGDQPRQFIIDKPFLIFLRETSTERPYLAAWIETAALLESL